MIAGHTCDGPVPSSASRKSTHGSYTALNILTLREVVSFRILLDGLARLG